MGIEIEGIVGGGAAPPPVDEAVQNSFLVSGGQVIWESAYNFRVSAAEYFINGEAFSSPESVITLDAAHATLRRFDVIAVDVNGAVVKITGTASAQPSEPDIDPGTQLKLALVSVDPSTTQPIGLVTTLVYVDNAGSPTEWDWTSSGASINVNSASNPRTGTKDIEGTTVVSGVYAQGEIGSGTLNPNNYNYLVLYIRSKAAWNQQRGLSVSLRLDDVLVGSVVNIRNTGTWGFESGTTGSYQVIGIPIFAFSIPIGMLINQVRIADFGGSIGFFIDDISFQGSAVTVTPTPEPPSETPLTAGEFITNGLVVGYKFNQGSGQVLTDSGPNFLHGQLGSTAGADADDPTWVSPRGLTFDGANDNVRVLTPNTALRLTTALSIEIAFRWVTGNSGLFDKTGGGATNANYAVLIQAGGLILRIVKAAGNNDITIGIALTPSGLYHFVCTWDGVEMRLYQDGNLAFARLQLAAPSDDVDGIALIGHLGSGVFPLNGTIYKLAVYDRALSPSEIRVLHEVGLP